MSEFTAKMQDGGEMSATFDNDNPVNATFTNGAGLSASMPQAVGLSANFAGNEKPFSATFGNLNVVRQDSIACNTTEGWNTQRDLISRNGILYVYTDYRQIDDGAGGVKNVPGFKIGDGKAYLIDLPFADALTEQHIADAIVHVTAEERAFWNNKVRAFIDGNNLILTQH